MDKPDLRQFFERNMLLGQYLQVYSDYRATFTLWYCNGSRSYIFYILH